MVQSSFAKKYFYNPSFSSILLQLCFLVMLISFSQQQCNPGENFLIAGPAYPYRSNCSPSMDCNGTRVVYMIAQNPPGTIHNLILCTTCPCPNFDPLIPYNIVSYVNTYYSCQSGCPSHCYPKVEQQIQYGGPGILKDIVYCEACSSRFGNYCIQCTDSICTLCQTGFYVAGGGSYCQLSCPYTDCLTCEIGPVCITCKTNFYLFSSTCKYLKNQACLPCSTLLNCVTCSTDSFSCLDCAPNYAINYGNMNQTCILCTDIPNCFSCSDGPICDVCQTGFYPNDFNVDNQCIPCNTMPNCATCQNNIKLCTGCSANYALDLSATNPYCIICSSIINCISCIDGPKCVNCIVNYIPDPLNNYFTCKPCLPYEFSSNGICIQCSSAISKCLTCYHTGDYVNCTLCQLKSTPHTNSQTCVDCSTITNHCELCSDMYTCSKCEYPYVLGQTGICNKCDYKFEYFEGNCTRPAGCLVQLPDFSKCISCRAANNLVYNSAFSNCQCNYGYKSSIINNATFCVSNCGNGFTTFPEQQCDDGNLRSNDGCSKNCQIQNNFHCTLSEPSQCILYQNFDKLIFNYAYRIEGENKGRFSLSLVPMQEVFQFVDWSKYLNIQNTGFLLNEFIITSSIVYEYQHATNELLINFEYKKTLQDLNFKIFLLFQNDQSPLTSQNPHSMTNIQKVKRIFVDVSSSSPLIVSNPTYLEVQFKINGINAQLVFQQQSILKAFKISQITFSIITIIIIIQFFIASYRHKMIGLETIQIFQTFYFITMIVDQKSTSILKSLNLLKYSAYGGYSNFELIYGTDTKQIQALSYNTVNEKFVSIGLMKYYIMNTNFPLILVFLSLSVHFIYFLRKSITRHSYLNSKKQQDKDQYTVIRRSTQWVHNHYVFPLVNVVNLSTILCIILYLQASSHYQSININNSDKLELMEKINYCISIALIFSIFFIFSNEIFESFQQYKHSQLTQSQRANAPVSLIQKLEHDENNPDRQNYKPGYVFVYLIYYLVICILLILSVLKQQINKYGVIIIIGTNFIYFLIVCKWNPYYEVVNIHNISVKFNHFSTLIFLIVCQIFNNFTLSPLIVVILVYFNIILLLIVAFLGFVRIYVEHCFRKKLEQNPFILEENKISKQLKQNNKLMNQFSKKQKLLYNNKFIFDNQLKDLSQQSNKRFQYDTERQNIGIKKDEIRKQIKSKRKQNLQKLKNMEDLNSNQKNKEDIKQPLKIRQKLINNKNSKVDKPLIL